jgi:hypothetical protein
MPNVETEARVEVATSVQGREQDSVVFGTAIVLPAGQSSAGQVPIQQIADDNDARTQQAVVAALNAVFEEEVGRLLKQIAVQAHSKA